MPESTPTPAGTAPRQSPDIAPPWHTATLIALIIAVAVLGTLLTSRGVAVRAPSRSIVYVQMLLVAWGLLFYVCRLGRPRNALATLLGVGWTSVGRAGTDLGLAALGWLLIKAGELAWLRLFPTAVSTSVTTLLPHTGLESLTWVIVAVSVGFSEEVVFRGYLQAQLTALTGRANVAWVLQALLFGLAHGEQGLYAMVRIAGYGLAFGALSRWRQSLLPGILCHVWTNLASGLLRS